MKPKARICAAAAMGLTAATLIGYSAVANAAAATTSITVQPGAVGNALPAGFTGLSLPPGELAANDFAQTHLGAYLARLGGTGVIRIGGSSADTTFWTSTGEAAPSWATGTITPASLKPLAAVAKASGWRVILGVNLEHFDPARAADEARNAQQVLGSSLLGIEAGDDPNLYYASTSTYFSAFEAYAAAIKQAAPGAALIGPDPSHNEASFLSAFASNEAVHPDVAGLADHIYPTSACNGSAATIPALLGSGSVQDETSAASTLVTVARQLNVPAAVDETNSTVCGGTAGVSDVYATALWALDYNLLLARSGVANADFEGGISGCGAYSPLCESSGGTLTAQPVFYGLIATSLVGTGNFVSVTNPDSASVRAYAVKNGSDLTVVLDDVQDPSSNGPTSVSLHLGATFPQGQMTVLATSSSAGLSAKTGITLGGQQIGPDGSFPAPTSTPVTVTGQTATVSVNAGSAAIIKFSGSAGAPQPTGTPLPTSAPTPSGTSTPSPSPSAPSPSAMPSSSAPSSSAPSSSASPTSASASSSGSGGSLDGFFAPAFSGTSFCHFGHQNFSISNGVLTTFYPAGSSSPTAGSPFGGAQDCIPAAAGPQPTMTLTYSVRFPVGFQFVKGGKLPGIYGGVQPFSGGKHTSDGWSMRLMWRAAGAGEVYSYTAKSTGFGDDYGRGNFSWQADGNWHTVSEHVTINTPGTSDGSVTLSYDGKQVIDQTGIDVTGTNTPAAGLFFSTFYGGHDSSWAPSADESLSFKDFSISG
jgi:hypothetical protein